MITILRFEVARRLRLLSTYLLALLFFGLGMLFAAAGGNAIEGAVVDFGTGSKVYVNAPFSLYVLILLAGAFGLVITAAIAGGAAQQDFEHGAAPFFFTAPISKLDYLGGRFLGALVVLFLMHAGTGLGAWASIHAGWMDPARLGPDRAAAYVIPYLTAIAPNLFFSGAVFFSIGVFSKRMLPVYVTSVVFLVGYLIATNLVADVQSRALAALLDPFGLQAVDALAQYWSVVERNDRLVPLEGPLFHNRLIWTGLGAAVLALTYARFRFAAPGDARPAVAREGTAPGEADEPAGVEAAPSVRRGLPEVGLSFTPLDSLRLLLSLTRLQARETMKSVFFLVVVLSGVLFIVSSASTVGQLFGTKTYPVTYEVLELLGGSFSFFILIVITFYSGELVWRERDAGLGQIHDATPVPRWVLFTSKLFTLMAIQVVLLAIVMVSGLSLQTLRGYHHYEIGLYVQTLFGIRLLQFWSLCVLGITVHSVLNHKLAGHAVMILFLISTLALPALGFEHPLYRYGSGASYRYSAMNGFGHYTAPVVWLAAYWTSAATALAMVGHAFWPRGMPGRFRERLRQAVPYLKHPALFVTLACVAAIGAFIYHNASVKNPHRTRWDVDELRARYEKTYGTHDARPQPRIVSVHAEVHIFPERRSVRYRGRFTVENRTREPLSEVALTIPPEARIAQLEFEGGSSPVLEDRTLGFSVHRLAQPLAPGARLGLDFELLYENRGFRFTEVDDRIVRNGTFIDSDRGPTIGYRKSMELDDDQTRRRHGLEPRRWAAPDDPLARSRNHVVQDSDWIRFDAVVSTSADQIPITSGRVERAWEEGGRRYIHYVVDSPMIGIYSFLSARYAVVRDRWNDVDIEINHHPGHEYDVDRMIRGVKASLGYFTKHFGPYQHSLVRIVEFPRYEQFAQSFPNTIPYSESIGFIAQVDDDDPAAIDYPFYVTAHEVAHQWWAHQVVGADAQGSTLLSETLAEYSALMVMKQAYGPLAMRKFLRYQLDRYLSGRGREARPERPLVRVEDSPHIHYAKGSLAMYALADAIGEDRVNEALRRFCAQHGGKGPPYPVAGDLVEAFRTVAPQSGQLIHDLFETITLFELRAVSAKAVSREGGGVDVHLTGKVKKLRADELGREQEVPVDDDIPVGVLDKDGVTLLEQRVRVKGEDLDVVLRAPDGAEKAAIDPSSAIVDRRPEDNVIAIER